MRRLLIIAITLVCLVPLSVRAQSTPNPVDCTERAVALIKAWNADVTPKALIALEFGIHALNASCNGWIFKGTQSKVEEPITLPVGGYFITLLRTWTTQGVVGRVISGTCGNTSASTQAFSIGGFLGGDAEVLSQSVGSHGCVVILDINSDTAKGWTILVEPEQ